MGSGAPSKSLPTAQAHRTMSRFLWCAIAVLRRTKAQRPDAAGFLFAVKALQCYRPIRSMTKKGALFFHDPLCHHRLFFCFLDGAGMEPSRTQVSPLHQQE